MLQRLFPYCRHHVLVVPGDMTICEVRRHNFTLMVQLYDLSFIPKVEYPVLLGEEGTGSSTYSTRFQRTYWTLQCMSPLTLAMHAAYSQQIRFRNAGHAIVSSEELSQTPQEFQKLVLGLIGIFERRIVILHLCSSIQNTSSEVVCNVNKFTQIASLATRCPVFVCLHLPPG